MIDALFGAGVNRPLSGAAAKLVEHINQSGAKVISIDLPSGMIADQSSINYPVIKATHTLTFQVIKRCLLMAENEPFFGKFHVLNIGLHDNFLKQVSSPFRLVSPAFYQRIIQAAKDFSHKGNYGHSLIIAGGHSKMGAAVLATGACLRSGAGLVTTCVDEASFPSCI